MDKKFIEELTKEIVALLIKKDLTHAEAVEALGECRSLIIGHRVGSVRSKEKLKYAIGRDYLV